MIPYESTHSLDYFNPRLLLRFRIEDVIYIYIYMQPFEFYWKGSSNNMDSTHSKMVRSVHETDNACDRQSGFHSLGVATFVLCIHNNCLISFLVVRCLSHVWHRLRLDLNPKKVDAFLVRILHSNTLYYVRSLLGVRNNNNNNNNK